MDRTASPAGLYGKVPGYGDFLHRRLPSSFVEPWNAWVSAAMADSRGVLKEAWMQAYLTSPPWRFVIEPGILGDTGWIGTWASSVDSVGRCYPIVTAIALHEHTRIHWLGGDVAPVSARLEAVALGLIDGSLTPEAALDRIDEIVPSVARGAAPVPLLSRGGAERLVLGTVPSPLASLAMRWSTEVSHPSGDPALSAWWHGEWDGAAPASLITAGLPSAEAFRCFLDGTWRERDWVEQLSDGEAP